MLANNSKPSTGCPNTYATAGSAIFSNLTSIGHFPANDIGARRCRFGCARRPATWRPSGNYEELLAKSRAEPAPRFGRRPRQANPESARRSEGPQTVHRCDNLRFAEIARGADAPRSGGDRLLVRLRRHAFCPMGLSAQARLGRTTFRSVSRPTSSAKRSTRPEAGSTVWWRSARCCLTATGQGSRFVDSVDS